MLHASVMPLLFACSHMKSDTNISIVSLARKPIYGEGKNRIAENKTIYGQMEKPKCLLANNFPAQYFPATRLFAWKA